ncbi:MAG: hypothetical protein DRG63_10250 [Deltaproteobacteria bacterium]|nr:MAG: hypothetical protein DRG63_10250 [Deltaproteobacteria bacterium]
MKKKMFSTQVKNELLKEFKKLAIDLERPINDVLEEAMLDLLEKYGIEFKVETLAALAKSQQTVMSKVAKEKVRINEHVQAS